MTLADIDYDDVFYEDRMSTEWSEEEADYPDHREDVCD